MIFIELSRLMRVSVAHEMASGTAAADGGKLLGLVDLKNTINSVLCQGHFKNLSDRCDQLQRFGKSVLDAFSEFDSRGVLQFAADLDAEFNKIVQAANCYKLYSTKREKAWSMFHSFRCEKLVDLWKELFKKLDVSGMDRLFIQSITQELFEIKLKANFHYEQENLSEVLNETISEDEKNVMMYACGYVPVSLIRRYEKFKGSKYATFVQCLQEMAIGVCEDSFHDYARKWFESINRGGAFELGDSTFDFFLIVEKKIRAYLKALNHNSQQRSTVIDKLLQDEDILFHWCMLYVDLSEAEANELLKDVLGLWLNIRGFSVTGLWNEQYKKLCNETTKAKPSLRKGLKKKKKSEDSNEKKTKSADLSEKEEAETKSVDSSEKDEVGSGRKKPKLTPKNDKKTTKTTKKKAAKKNSK